MVESWFSRQKTHNLHLGQKSAISEISTITRITIVALKKGTDKTKKGMSFGGKGACS